MSTRTLGHCVRLICLPALALLGSGCMSLGDFAALPPIDNSHMSHAIAQIAPLGTPRDEAIQRLKAAGVEGEYLRVEKMFVNAEGPRPPQQATTLDNFFVCERWVRPNGELWQFQADLEFDETGRLSNIHSGEPWRASGGPGAVMLTRFQRRPDGSMANLGLARDGDVPRLLHATSNGQYPPGAPNSPQVAVAFTNSPNALDKTPR